MDNARRSRHALRVVVLEDPGALRQWATAWEDLAAHAAEPNPFYEPWMLLPAIQFLSRPAQLLFVLVTAESPVSGLSDVLHGLFPIERSSRYRGLPLKCLSIWKHRYCYLCTPLIRKGSEEDALAALFDWLATDPHGATLVEFPQVTDDEPVFRALVTLTGERRRPFFLSKRETRAMLRRRADAEAYIEEALPGKSRKEYRRLEHRLSELGRLEYGEPGPAEIDAWIDAFLELEARGWKGRLGTAMASTEAGRRFFTAVARAGPDRVMLLGLHAGGTPVALKCNLLAGDGAFAFKIAFDEAQGRFSPGVLLELENIRQFHHRAPRWMDSCAVPDHFMANRLWLDRRTVSTLLVSTGGAAGDLLVASLRPLRSAFLMMRGSRGTKAGHATHADDGRPSTGTRHRRVSASGQGASLLDVAPEALRASFGRTPFRVRHHLGESGLFQLPRLLELARHLPESSVEYNAGNVPITLDPSETPRTGLSVEETLRRIESCRSWMVLKNVEQDPEYRDLLETCLEEVRRLSHAVSPGMSRKEGFIFISSPGSVTPYHMDPEENFLLQIRGRKTIHVFDARDRSIVSDEQIERFLTGANRNLVFRDEYQPRARIFPLGPGKGVHVPVTAPHWVQNGEEVSISFSLTFQTRSSIRLTHAHRMNAAMRRWGLEPRPVGDSLWRDVVKQFAYRATNRVSRMLPELPAPRRVSQR
ncbi:MAG TPA: GNAT family N-acetyltransferase [Vicinamibacterales bacterium]|nr:GNAT family N-acetyltransferase [Vicinamibacterales bacterium]